MQAKIVGMCRGDGKAYIKISVTELEDDQRIRIEAHTGEGQTLPASLYPLSAEAEAELNFVAMVPLMSVSREIITLVALNGTGGAVDSCELPINMGALKWKSRANYLFNKRLTEEIRDIDKTFVYEQITVELQRMIDDGESVVMRMRLRMPAIAGADMVVRVLDASGAPSDMRVTQMGQMVIPAERVEERDQVEKLVSVHVPKDTKVFCVIGEDVSAQVRTGFYCMDEQVYDFVLNLAAKETLSAAEDPDYDAWERAHAATAADLIHQRESAFDFEPLMGVVVLQGSQDEAAREATIKSIAAQTYRRRVLIDAQQDVGACDYLCFVEAGDLIEPDALFEYVRALNENSDADLLYCDEDQLNADGAHVNACFKPDYSPDLLNAYNYLGHMVCAKSSIVAAVDLAAIESRPAYYDAVLRLSESAASVYHVSRVLYHAASGSLPVGVLADAGEYESGRAALEQHLARSGRPALVTKPNLRRAYRVDYEIPDHPLVSIIIPSRDQIGLLETCVRSILQKSTYDRYEIIVIENNSEETATFDGYRELQEADARVRVETFESDGSFNFSKLMNFGTSKAQGDYLLLLNNDTEVIAADFISHMLGFFTDPEVGVVGGKLLYRDGTIQHAGVIMGPASSASHLHYCLSDADGGYFDRADCIQDLTCVTGACQLIRKTVYEEVGGYTEEFPVGYNDVDFCLKVRAVGRRIVYTPYARLFHYEYSSRGRDESISARIRGERERSLLRYKWAEYYIEGDPYYNVNLEQTGLYFGLGAND